MKRLLFGRKAILRAIHSAAVVFMILLNQQHVNAQMATGDGNGNVTISGSGTEYVYGGTNPSLAQGRAFVDVGLDAQVANNVTMFVDIKLKLDSKAILANPAQAVSELAFSVRAKTRIKVRYVMYLLNKIIK